jgi:hypothetical protein
MADKNIQSQPSSDSGLVGQPTLKKLRDMGDGTYAEVYVTTRDFFIDVGFGLVPGYRRVAALGNNPSVDAAALPEDIWPGGGAYPWMTAATALQIRSTSAQDAPAGTGIASVSASFLDATYAEEAAVVTTLNGLTAVPISGTHFRINAARGVSKGSGAPAFGATNAGDIIIEDVAGPNTIRAIIPAGANGLRQSIYTVPLGHTLQILNQAWGFAEVTGGNKFAKFANYSQGSNGIFSSPLNVSVGDEPPYDQPGLPGIPVLEKTDFCYRCTSASAGTHSLFASWLGILKNNTYT